MYGIATMSSFLNDQASVAKKFCQHRAPFKFQKGIPPNTHLRIKSPR